MIECEGIVLRQTKILKGRRMILLLTEKYGLISCGTSVSERSKSRSALAMRPFSRGIYQIRQDEKSGRTYYNIISGEVIKSYYEFGEDYDKFTNASLVLEFTAKTLIEDAAVPEQYGLLVEYLDMLALRVSGHKTLTVSYLIGSLKMLGVWPERENFSTDELLSDINSDIINELIFLMDNPIGRMRNLILDEDISVRLIRLILRFAERHLDIGSLKSDLIFNQL
jgi:DNA repair protein RecO (recombination protein O)